MSSEQPYKISDNGVLRDATPDETALIDKVREANPADE
jgi:hypothetical protein